MKVSEFYQSSSKFLKASDLNGKKHRVEIASVGVIEFKDKDGKPKMGLSFKGREKGLVLNVTNARLIAAQFGDDSASWVGKTIIIFPTTTDFGGEQVDCIRVEQVIPEATFADDDIPF